MEANSDGQEDGRGGGHEEGQRDSSRCWQELWHEWKRSCTCICRRRFRNEFTYSVQFTYNPEWFEDEEDEEDDWDLAKYRKEKEEEDLAQEEARIRDLSLQDGGSPGQSSSTGD